MEIIEESLLIEGSTNPGCAILMFDDSDQIADGFKEIFGVQNLPVNIPTGHSSCAIIKPNGSVVGISFGPPACSRSKTKDMIDKIGQQVAKKIGLLGSMKVNVKSLGRVTLSKRKLTASSAKSAAKLLKKQFHSGRGCTYYAYNDVDANKSLTYAGSDGRCKLYSPMATFEAGTGLGIDNCASFAIDVIATGKTDVGSSVAQVLQSPALSCRAANISFGGSDFKGTL